MLEEGKQVVGGWGGLGKGEEGQGGGEGND